MNNINHQLMIKEATQGKFKGSDTLQAKVQPRYPMTAEREYQRLTRAYIKLMKDALRKHLPAIMEICKHSRKDSRLDSNAFNEERIRQEIRKIAEDIEQATGKFGLDDYVEKIANITNARSISDWKRLVKKTLGINIFEDYYKGEAYAEAMKRWVANNISKIKTLPNQTLDDMEQIIIDGYRNGYTLDKMKKDIQSKYDVDKRRAELLARDQVATLNAQITKMQQTDAGVTKYKWSTSKDSRVRECHEELHGNIFSWDDPPEMWYSTKDGSIVYTGRFCHPGEDYYCRCCAIPVFDWQTIDLPMKGD